MVRPLVSAPSKNMNAMVRFILLLKKRPDMITPTKNIATVKIHRLPTLSDANGMKSTVVDQPAKNILPISPIFSPDTQMRSSC